MLILIFTFLAVLPLCASGCPSHTGTDNCEPDFSSCPEIYLDGKFDFSKLVDRPWRLTHIDNKNMLDLYDGEKCVTDELSLSQGSKYEVVLRTVARIKIEIDDNDDNDDNDNDNDNDKNDENYDPKTDFIYGSKVGKPTESSILLRHYNGSYEDYRVIQTDNSKYLVVMSCAVVPDNETPLLTFVVYQSDLKIDLPHNFIPQLEKRLAKAGVDVSFEEQPWNSCDK